MKPFSRKVGDFEVIETAILPAYVWYAGKVWRCPSGVLSAKDRVGLWSISGDGAGVEAPLFEIRKLKPKEMDAALEAGVCFRRA